MPKAECPIINAFGNALGNWVLRSIRLDGYIFGDIAPEIKLRNIQAKGRLVLPDEKERRKILSAMDRQPIIADSTPVASLSSYAPYIRTEYNADEAERAKTGCVNDFCPAYFRFAGVACLGCTKKLIQYNFWLPPLNQH